MVSSFCEAENLPGAKHFREYKDTKKVTAAEWAERLEGLLEAFTR